MEKFQTPRNFIAKFLKKITSKTDSSIYFKNFPSFAVTLGELVLFYPVELGLGLHADVQRVRVNFVFSSYSFEEQFFLLRYDKIPVLS